MALRNPTRVRVVLDIDVATPEQEWRQAPRLSTLLTTVTEYAATRRHVVEVVGATVTASPS